MFWTHPDVRIIYGPVLAKRDIFFKDKKVKIQELHYSHFKLNIEYYYSLQSR